MERKKRKLESLTQASKGEHPRRRKEYNNVHNPSQGSRQHEQIHPYSRPAPRNRPTNKGQTFPNSQNGPAPQPRPPLPNIHQYPNNGQPNNIQAAPTLQLHQPPPAPPPQFQQPLPVPQPDIAGLTNLFSNWLRHNPTAMCQQQPTLLHCWGATAPHAVRLFSQCSVWAAPHAV